MGFSQSSKIQVSQSSQDGYYVFPQNHVVNLLSLYLVNLQISFFIIRQQLLKWYSCQYSTGVFFFIFVKLKQIGLQESRTPPPSKDIFIVGLKGCFLIVVYKYSIYIFHS